MTAQLPNRDTLARWTDRDQRTIKYLEDLTATANASAVALSSAGFGGVGSLGFVRHTTAAQAMVAGTIYDGAQLAYAGFTSDGTAFAATTGGAALAGQWQALGSAAPSAGRFAYTLALRVA